MAPKTIRVNVVFEVTQVDNDRGVDRNPLADCEVVSIFRASLDVTDYGCALSELYGSSYELPEDVCLEVKPISAHQI